MAKVRRKKGVKKRWFQMMAPPLFNNAHIGDTYVASPEDAFDRIVTVSMAHLSRDNSKQYIKLSFKITGEKDGILQTKFVGYKFSPNSNRKFVRRRRSKLEDSFPARTKDGYRVRLKPLVVTRTQAPGGVNTKLQKAAREFLVLRLHEQTIDEFWNDLVGYQVQRAMFDELKEIYPLSTCEIRWAYIEGEGAAGEVVEEESEEALEDESEEAEDAAESEEDEAETAKAK